MKTKNIIIAGLAGLLLTACAEDVTEQKMSMTSSCALKIEVSDNPAATRADYSGFPSTTFETGDAIGLYAFDGSSYVASNIRFVKQSDGSWTPDEEVPYVVDYTYYAYFPYRSTTYTPSTSGTVDAVDTKFDSFITDASNYFWQADQSTKAGYTYSNLMIAKGTITDADDDAVTIKFTMAHKRGLAVFTGDASEATFTGNIPYLIGDTKQFLMKPSSATSFTDNRGTYSMTASAGEYATHNIILTIDLSMVDNAGNDRVSMNTANCYMVHSAGKYKLPLVYGNAIKNGTTNTLSYAPNAAASSATYLTPFVNHADRGITNPWIKNNTYDGSNNITVNGAELVWQDVNGLIKNGSLTINGDYLEFEVDADHFANGNAVIAAKMGSTIVWSWHIWVTSETYTNLVTVNTGSHTYNIAPLTLGWNTTDHTATFYQWGRKDPLLPGGLGGDKTVYNINGSVITGLNWQNTDAETLGTNIQKPTMMNLTTSSYGGYFNGQQYNLWSVNNTGLNNVSSPTVKTIYDPCPPGFCLPSGELYYYLMQRLTATAINPSASTNIDCEFAYDNTNEGRPYIYDGHTFLFYSTGFRNSYSPDEGALRAVGENNERWECYTTSTLTYLGNCVRTIRAYKSPADIWRWDDSVRNSGLPVLPVAEQ